MRTLSPALMLTLCWAASGPAGAFESVDFWSLDPGDLRVYEDDGFFSKATSTNRFPPSRPAANGSCGTSAVCAPTV